MKIKKILIGAAVIYITYTTGLLVGHTQCLRNLANKYGKNIYDKDGKLTDQITKHFSITKFIDEAAAKAYSATRAYYDGVTKGE